MLRISNRAQLLNYIVLLCGIVILLNVVARTLFVRIDISEGQMYSLSESSKDVIGKLDDQLVARVFFSSDIPGTLANSRRYLQDMLEEYQAYSDGRFRFEFVNPDKDEKVQQQAQTYDIPPVQMQAVEDDKLEIKTVYMGMVFLYEDKRESIPVIQSTEGLEYNLTATIKKITSTNLKTIGIVSSEDRDVSTERLRQFLEQIYTVRTVSLKNEFPEDIRTVLMNGAVDSLDQDELFHLDQFLMRGGRLFMGQGRVRDMFQQGFAFDIRSNIFSLLENYGIRIENALLTDQSCGQIQMQSQQGFFVIRNAVDYPLFPVIQKFNREHPLTKDMSALRLFFVNEVQPASTVSNHFVPLAYTSDRTGILQGPMYQIHPSQNPMMKVFPFGTKTLAALIEGPIHSFFKDSAGYALRPGFISTSEEAKIVIITDNQFFNDQRAGGIPENTDFILNVVDYLSDDAELIGLRSRKITERPLDPLSEASRRTVKWLNMVTPVVVIIGAGLLRWRINRIRRKKLEHRYG
jgi:gliding-associated putative ABC transporter substrate-binding component GldG